jgi:hypothetical protein
MLGYFHLYRLLRLTVNLQWCEMCRNFSLDWDDDLSLLQTGAGGLDC